MGLRTYTKIPENTFKEIQENAGVLLKTFTPASPNVTASAIIGATTGGIQFADAPEFVDFGEDIDNCPKNMLELKKIDSREITLSGTFVTVNEDLIKDLVGNGSFSDGKFTPSDELKTSDFIKDLWWVTDYGEDGGFIAIHIMNALNTGGFSFQSSDKGKGQFGFTFVAHYSQTAQTTVPYEIYVEDGAA